MIGRRRVRERAREIGASVSELFAAELGALKADVRISFERLQTGGILVVAAAGALLIAAGALVLAAFEALSLILPRWAAALVVAAGMLVVGLVLYASGRRSLRRFESPARTARRHVEDHLEWLNDRLGTRERGDRDG